jgi:hypothetical protein
MKIILLISSTLIAITLLKEIDFYSEKKVNKLVDEVVSYITYDRGIYDWVPSEINPLPQKIYLGSMLYANIHANRPDTSKWWAAGKYTDESYKKGWKVLIANNPKIVFKSIDLYGKSFIDSLNYKLLEIRDKKLKESGNESFKLFKIEKYWENQNIILNKYKSLIDNLLDLDDKTLSKFIKSIGKEQSSCCDHPDASQIKAWLFKKQLIEKIPIKYYEPNTASGWNLGGWYLAEYPVDLLFLTYRVGIDFPEWENRKFLKETRKIIIKIQELIS